MGTDKRARQKNLRQVHQQRVREQQRRDARKSQITKTVAILGVFAIILTVIGTFIISSKDNSNVATSSSTSTPTTLNNTTASTSAPQPVAPGTGATVTGTTPCPKADGTSERTTKFEAAPPMCIDVKKTYIAKFDTTEGEIQVKLTPELTPNTTNNFVVLTRYHYYDNTSIFRLAPSIDIFQSGSPNTNTNTDPGPGYTIPDEGGTFDFTTAGGKGPFTDYQEGDLIMARSAGPNSSGAQYFFAAGPKVSNLNASGTYIPFGKTISGLDVAKKIMSYQVSADGPPSKAVVINSITIEES